jgi:hypothetical protein
MREVIPRVTIDFIGEEYQPDPDAPFTIGREGDLTLDEDNAFLHLSLIHIRRCRRK